MERLTIENCGKAQLRWRIGGFGMLEIRSIRNDKLDGFYGKCIEEVGEFFGIEWTRNQPNFILVSDREILNKFYMEKTEDWVAAVCRNRNVYLLSPENLEKESSHKYSDESYFARMKHEMVHCFWGTIALGNKPFWLNEGLAVYLSRKIDREEMKGGFSRFLSCYDSFGGDDYFEAGFAVRLLVSKFGKGKILELLKGLDSVRDEDGFYDLFEKVYGFRIDYEEMNKLMGEGE